MNITNQIIELIEKNRISSVEISDALGKKGVLHGLNTLNQGHFSVGKVKYIYGFDDSNWSIHEQAANVEENCVIFVDMINCTNAAAFGDLVSKFLVLYRKAKAVVVNGLLRDIHSLKKNNYPLWSKGVTPLGSFNRKLEPSNEIKEIVRKRKEELEDSIMICDDSGCTLIHKSIFNEDTLKKLDFIELQEDIWYYCIDTLKWNTYDTVCLKKYLTQRDELPKIFYERLSGIDLEAK